MRVLLDENLPRKLIHRFAGHEVTTVQAHGWAGRLNGDLLRAAAAEFDAFVTLDRGIEYQQDLRGLALRIVVVRAVTNQYPTLLPLVPAIAAALERIGPGEIAQVTG